MKEIITNNEFNVYRDSKKETLYKIKFTNQSYSLLRSIIKTNIIIGSTITEDYKSLIFQAISVKTLTQYQAYLKNTHSSLDIEKVLKMIYYLSTQLKYLINNENKCFYRYNPDNILVIDETKFIYLSNDDLLKTETETEIEIETKHIQFNTIFSREWFISPEILKINTIPETVNYKTIYYSLGALIIYCLYSINIFELDLEEDQNKELDQNKENKDLDKENKDLENKDLENKEIDQKIEQIIITIKGTKLYYFIKRCLNKTIEKRTLIYF